MPHPLLRRIALLTGIALAGGCGGTDTAPVPPPDTPPVVTSDAAAVAAPVPEAPGMTIAELHDSPVVDRGAEHPTTGHQAADGKPLPPNAVLCLSPGGALAIQVGELQMNGCPTELERSKAQPLSSVWSRRTGGPWIQRVKLLEASTADRCCYKQTYSRVPGTAPGKGRPLVVEGQVVRPAIQWHETPANACEAAAAWREDARLEASSVAAFQRTAAELGALGAPRALIDGCLTAATDEARHAIACLAVAERLDGGCAELGPQAPWQARDLDFVQLAMTTLLEGALPETMAAAEATLAADLCSDPVIRGVLRTIAVEEQAHADLGWAIIGWAREVGGSKVDQALASALADGPWALDEERADHAAGRLGRDARVGLLQGLFANVFVPLGERIAA